MNHCYYFYRRSWLAFVSIVVFSTVLLAQKPVQWTSGEIYEKLNKLNTLASVLYVAAHPDDENTRLISYLSNHLKAETTYLSLTRGDGGQNLIGKEIDEKLGVLRTQELLMARSVDNGKQMFSRANDFGYSKNAEETITIWDTEKVKADVAWAIRTTRPDIIINRFDHRTSGETHGHHTASAQLALEIFDKSNDPAAFTEQLKYTKTWQPRRIFFNTSWWFYGSQEKFEKADKSMLLGFDVGVYYPLLGKSNTEISAESRSKHKCQGFGSTGTRGSQMEYLELLKGDLPENKENVFHGINTTWTRVDGGAAIKLLVEKVISEYDFKSPEKSIPLLINVYQSISNISDEHWKRIKLQECKELIKACFGLFLEAKSNIQVASRAENLIIDVEAVKRLNHPLTIEKVYSDFFKIDTIIQSDLTPNQKLFFSFKTKIPETANFTTPYWLRKKGSLGTYEVENPEWIGKPETPEEANITFLLKYEDIEIPLVQKVIYKFNSPEEGEVYRPFEILPAISVGFTNNVFIFPDKNKQNVNVRIVNNVDNSEGKLWIPLPEGWSCQPEFQTFAIKGKGQSQEFNFLVTPPKNSQTISISPLAEIGSEIFTDVIETIKYDHIPLQMVQQKSVAKFVKLDIAIKPMKVGYIAGAGDVIPDYLEKMGYEVEHVSEDNMKTDLLKKYNCLIFGVRAYNTIENLKYYQNDIMKYVENGGKVVLQYNTSGSLFTKELGPYPFKISRDRVTVENAEMRLVNPNHTFLNFPNKITNDDFNFWVQERGLYFASEWDPRYQTIFSSNDPGESPKEGSLIVTRYGKGEFVYTGLSFFRQFPAGISGALRLFVNIITPNLSKTNGTYP
jgi:LmbE family N-acetylglucosaminyl deacetylase